MRAAATLFASCALLLSAQASSATPEPNCTTGACEITVIVPGGCGSGIQVAPDPIRVPAAHGSTTMTWVLRSRGWKFDEKGIDVQNAPSNPFTLPGKATGPTASAPATYTVVNKHLGSSSRGTFKYDINLIGPDGKPCQLDPIIVNH
jgi:hypothetical protein